MSNDLKDFLLFLCAFVAGMFVFVAIAMFVVVMPVEWTQCRNYEKATGRPTKYEGLNCYVQDKQGDWYRLDELVHRRAR